MKILLVSSYAESVVAFRGPLIREFVRLGFEVIVTAPDVNAEIQNNIAKLNARVIEVKLQRTSTNPLNDLVYCYAMKRLIRLEKPNLVLTYTAKPNIWASIAAASEKVKSVSMITGLGYAFTENGSSKQKLMKLILKKLYKFSTGFNHSVIFQNPDDKQDFIDSGCLADTNKAKLVNGSGVDIDHYAQTPLPSEPVFLLIARLLGNKGVREYVNASKLVKAKYPNARFLLVGFIDEGPDAIHQAELDDWITSGIEFLGQQKDVRTAISQCSVYVLPSYREGTPRSVLEAMAMGRAIVTTNAPGCRETVEQNANGFLVPVKDFETLAIRLIELTKDSSLRNQFGSHSRDLAVLKYDVNVVNQKLIQHLKLTMPVKV